MAGYVQSNTLDGGMPGSVAFTTANLTAGNTLILIARVGNTLAGLGTVTCSDTTNGAWTAIPNFGINDVGGESIWGFYFANTAGGVKPTVTITATTNSGSCRAYIEEVATSVTASPIDNSNAAGQNLSTSWTGATAATTNANDHLIAFLEQSGGSHAVTNNVAGSNPSSGWTNKANVAVDKLWVDVNDVTSTGTYGENWTLAAADVGGTGIVAVKTSAGATPPPFPGLAGGINLDWPLQSQWQPYPNDRRTFTASYNQNLIGRDRGTGAPLIGAQLTELPPRAPPRPDATFTASYNSNLIGKDFIQPSAIADQITDLPPRAYPRLEQTWWQSLVNSTLRGQDVIPPGAPGDQIFDLPRAPWRPDETWLWSYNKNLIGQDFLPPGETYTEVSPRSAPVQHAQRTWAWWYNQNLIGKDSLPPGEQIFDSARGIRFDAAQIPAFAGLLATPFAQYDWKIPARSSPIDPTWSASYNPNLIGKDTLPPRNQVFDVVRGQIRLDSSLSPSNLLQTTLAVIGGPLGVLALQYDWKVPAAASPSVPSWTAGYNPNLIGKDIVPGGRTFDLTGRPPRLDATWTASYNLSLIGQDRLPTGATLFDTPQRITWQRDWSQNLLESTLAALAIQPTPFDWPAPSPSPYPPDLRTWAASYNPNLVGKDQLPIGQKVIDAPARVPWLRDLTVNLLQSTLAPSLGPLGLLALQTDWPTPTSVPRLGVSVTSSFPLVLVGQDKIPPGAPGDQIFDLPRRPSLLDPTWISVFNLNLIGKDVVPGGRVFDLTGRQPRLDATWTASYDLSLIGKDQFPPGHGVFDIARGQIRFDATFALNLLESTLGVPPVPPPFPGVGGLNFDWPIPRAPYYGSDLRFWSQVGPASQYTIQASSFDWNPPWFDRYTSDLRTWAQGTGINLFSVAPPPFPGLAGGINLDWPLPKRPSPIDPTWTASYPLELIGKDKFPPGLRIFDTPSPVQWQRDLAVNLLQTTLAPTLLAPFQLKNYDWPLPKRPSPIDPTWIGRYILELIGQDKLPVGARLFDLSPIAPPRLGVPVAFTESFPLSLIGKDLFAFRQQDWPLQKRPAPIDPSWLRSFPLVLIGKDRLPLNQKDWPLGRGPQPLLQTWYWPQPFYYQSIIPPFAQRDWPVPLAPPRQSMAFTASFPRVLRQYRATPFDWNPPWFDRYTSDLRTWAQGPSISLRLKPLIFNPNLIALGRHRTMVVSAVPRNMIVAGAPRKMTAREASNTPMSQENVLVPNFDATVENQTVTFDYGKILGTGVNPSATITSILSITCTVIATASTVTPDQTPGSRLIGSPSIGQSPFTGVTNQAVYQLVGGGVAGNTYQLQCVVHTSDGQDLSIKTQWTAS